MIFPTASISGGRRRGCSAIARTLQSRGWVRRAYPARGRDLWTGEEMAVLALEVRSYGLLYRLKNWLGALPAGVECYNCDLDVATYYLYVRRLFPCAWYRLEAQGGRLLRLEPLEEAFALEFSPPPLTTLTLGLTRDPLIPLGAGNGLALGWEGETLELEAPDIPGLLRDLARRLQRADPDLVLSAWGDEEIIPTLTRWSLGSRGAPAPGPGDRAGGPQIRRLPQLLLLRPHRLPGLRRPLLRPLAPGPAQFLLLSGGRPPGAPADQPHRPDAAATGGPGLSRHPDHLHATGPGHGRRHPHPLAQGRAGTLQDRGRTAHHRQGRPHLHAARSGLHFNVAEVDFASMYPTIMAIHNISPETVNCPCCAERQEPAEAVASGQWPVLVQAAATSPVPRSLNA